MESQAVVDRVASVTRVTTHVVTLVNVAVDSTHVLRSRLFQSERRERLRDVEYH